MKKIDYRLNYPDSVFSQEMIRLEFSYKNEEFDIPIGAGLQDRIVVRRDRDAVYIGSINRNLDYCGLEVYLLNEREYHLVAAFLQNAHDMEDIIGSIDMEDITLFSRMVKYWYEIAY